MTRLGSTPIDYKSSILKAALSEIDWECLENAPKLNYVLEHELLNIAVSFSKKEEDEKKLKEIKINQLTFNSVELPVVVTKSFSESRISKVWRSYSGGSILCCVPPHHLMSLFTRIDPYKPDGMRDLSMRRCGQRQGAHKCKSHNGLLVARKTWISVFVYKRECSDEWKYFMYNIKQKIYLQIHRILS